MKVLNTGFFLFLIFAVFGATISAQNSDNKKINYHLLQKIEVGGEGGWDYLFADGDAHRLYVSHSTKVVVVDTETNKIIGEIPNLKGVHGIAVDSKSGHGFISDGRDNSVVIFDLKTLKVLSTVPVGKNPDCVIYDSATKRIFAFNRGDSSISVIDAKTEKVVGTIDLGGHPEFATSDGKNMVYVNLDDKSEVVAIDSSKLEIKNRWSLAPQGEDPSGMAIDRKNRRLFIGCGNEKMIVMNADNGKILAALPIGEGVDAVGFDEKTKLAFSSNGEGTLTVVREDSPDKFSVVEDVKTQRGTRTMAVDTKTHKVYTVTAQFGETPAPTKERPNPRPSIVPNSFVVLVYGN